MQEKLEAPVRYMIQAEGFRPVFATYDDNKSLLLPVGLYNSVYSTPNLTGRLEAIVAYAEEQLARIVDARPNVATTSVVKIAEILAKYGKQKIAAQYKLADELLHIKEFALWKGWFTERHYEAWGAAEHSNFAEMERLEKLQYNGRAPF